MDRTIDGCLRMQLILRKPKDERHIKRVTVVSCWGTLEECKAELQEHLKVNPGLMDMRVEVTFFFQPRAQHLTTEEVLRKGK